MITLKGQIPFAGDMNCFVPDLKMQVFSNGLMLEESETDELGHFTTVVQQNQPVQLRFMRKTIPECN